MSVKSQFLKKLQAIPPAPVSFTSKTQADIAEFRHRITQLQEQMDAWLTGTGLNVETFPVSVTDLLVEGEAFGIAGIVLRYRDRCVKFTPVFLYGHGVTGCVETTFHDEQRVTSLGRLFMRSGSVSEWASTPPGVLYHDGKIFDENVFFELIITLLS
ncbi:hypothetical protein D9O29_13740 [Pantoea vagans]|uniref:Uncharacterized protein n=1 Tax=Pantoea vagans TaxID=470934 RepID=A0ABY3LEJ5_9GAMM|nr:hypothetical protein D9O29_13740 [Pantoea vagans]